MLLLANKFTTFSQQKTKNRLRGFCCGRGGSVTNNFPDGKFLRPRLGIFASAKGGTKIYLRLSSLPRKQINLFSLAQQKTACAGFIVGEGRLELPPLSGHAPKACTATNYVTRPLHQYKHPDPLSSFGHKFLNILVQIFLKY